MSEDLISRKAAIDAIWDGTNMDIYTREVKEILEGLPSAPPVCIAKVSFDKAEMKKIIEDLVEQMEISVSEWIPVSERLPEPYQRCLFTVETPRWENEPIEYIVIAKAYGGEQNFTAWMPFPEPYKVESGVHDD